MATGRHLCLVQDFADDAKGLWDRRVPYPIERGARRVAFSHLWNDEGLSSADVRLQAAISELNDAVDRLTIQLSQG